MPELTDEQRTEGIKKLDQRNTETVVALLRERQKDFETLLKRFEKLHAAFCTLQVRMDEQERTVSLMRAKLAGSGSTAE